jgi:hypothetical protein
MWHCFVLFFEFMWLNLQWHEHSLLNVLIFCVMLLRCLGAWKSILHAFTSDVSRNSTDKGTATPLSGCLILLSTFECVCVCLWCWGSDQSLMHAKQAATTELSLKAPLLFSSQSVTLLASSSQCNCQSHQLEGTPRQTNNSSFFFFVIWGLNSGPILWATPPALFVKGFFETGSYELFAQAGFESQSSWSLPPE